MLSSVKNNILIIKAVITFLCGFQSHPSERTRAPSQTALTENRFCEKKGVFPSNLTWSGPDLSLCCPLPLIPGWSPEDFSHVLCMWVGVHTFLACFRVQKKKEQLAGGICTALGADSSIGMRLSGKLLKDFSGSVKSWRISTWKPAVPCCQDGLSLVPFRPSWGGIKLVSWKL